MSAAFQFHVEPSSTESITEPMWCYQLCCSMLAWSAFKAIENKWNHHLREDSFSWPIVDIIQFLTWCISENNLSDAVPTCVFMLALTLHVQMMCYSAELSFISVISIDWVENLDWHLPHSVSKIGKHSCWTRFCVMLSAELVWYSLCDNRAIKSSSYFFTGCLCMCFCWSSSTGTSNDRMF